MSTTQRTLDEQVEELVNQYKDVKSVHPIANRLFEKSPEIEKAFWDALAYDLVMINQRSTDIASGEITVFQKAFKILMDRDINGLAAVGLYCQELMGLRFIENAAEKEYILNSAVTTRRHIKSYVFGENFRPAGTSDLKRLESPASGEKSEDPRLSRLISLYYNAKKDFDSSARHSLERTKCAKFLRDTTENTMQYIQVKNLENSIDTDLWSEMESLLEYISSVVEAGCGGKKRRFEGFSEAITEGLARAKDAPESLSRAHAEQSSPPPASLSTSRPKPASSASSKVARRLRRKRASDRYRPDYE